MHHVIGIFSSIFSPLIGSTRRVLLPHKYKSFPPTEGLGEYSDSKDSFAEREAIPIIEARSNIFTAPLRLQAQPSWNLNAARETRRHEVGVQLLDNASVRDSLEMLRSRRGGGRDMV